MSEVTVGAYGQDLGIERLDYIVLDGNCRQFRRSDKHKITRVEADNDPVPPVIR
jgi:hypothetical protein